MSHDNESSLGEAIQGWLKSRGFTEKVLIQRIINDWPKIMGNTIAENTEHLFFKDGVFYVKMKTPVWKNELSMARSKIREMLNRELGAKLVKQVNIY